MRGRASAAPCSDHGWGSVTLLTPFTSKRIWPRLLRTCQLEPQLMAICRRNGLTQAAASLMDGKFVYEITPPFLCARRALGAVFGWILLASADLKL